MSAPSPIIIIDGQSYFVRRPTGESPNLWQFDATSETWEDATKVRDLPVGFDTQDVADAIAYSQRTDKPNLDTEAARLVQPGSFTKGLLRPANLLPAHGFSDPRDATVVPRRMFPAPGLQIPGHEHTPS